MPSGGGAPPGELVTILQFEGASILSGVDPVTGTPTLADYPVSVIAHDALDAAHSDFGGNPYTFVESYDSDNELDAVDTEYNEYDVNADALDPSTDISAAIALALTEVEDSGNLDLDPANSVQIAALVTAMQNSSKVEMLKDVSRAFTGLYEIRGLMSTQMGVAVAQIEHQRGIALADQEARLRIFAHRERTEAVLQVANTYLRENQSRVEQGRLAAAMRGDIARNRIVAEMDRINFDTHIESKEALWDLELFQYYGNILASLSGAASLPRAMTERERVLNGVMTSLSGAIQAGQATGSPGLGVAFGVASLAANLWGQNII